MALKPSQLALLVASFGTVAFIFGIIAEHKKPAAGTKIEGKSVIICKFPNDPTVAFGSLSAVALLVSAVLGYIAVFFPYKGQSVPTRALFHSSVMTIFFTTAIVVTVWAQAMMLWATITESLHRSRNIHHNLDAECPTAKTGLFGGAALLALDASLLWLICMMLANNARADYLEDDDPRGTYGQVVATEYEASLTVHPA